MKANYMNYFKGGKLYQFDKNKDVITISNTNITEEFCLDQKGMEMFLKFDNPEITLDSALKVKSGKLKSTIKVVTETNFVEPTLEFTNSFKLNVDKLKVAMKYVAEKDSRPALTGVNVSNNYINATDSMYAYRTECANDCNLTLAIEFVNAISKTSGEVEIKYNGKQVYCEVNDTIYIGRLIDAAYPDLARIYDSKSEKQVSVNKEQLKEMLSYSQDKKDRVFFEPNKIMIQGENDFESEIDFPIECKICFNISRLLTILNSISGDTVTFNYIDGMHAVFINDEFLLLPVRVN